MDCVNFFELVFKDYVLDQTGETQVCCPFPHKAGDTEYLEINPSAGVNLDKGLFHCFTCGRGFNEKSFAAEYLKINYEDAVKLLSVIHKSDSLDTWKHCEDAMNVEEVRKLVVDKLNFSMKTIRELHIGNMCKDEIIFPVIMFGRIIDKVTYRPGKKPKYIRSKNSISGIPVPYDIWVESKKEKPTLICAGEKDMCIARTKGFNAIEFTGGENNTPTMFLEEFKDREVYIIYDNDDTGKNGAKKLALTLRNYAKAVYVVDLSETCTEKGEDLWDYFCKYGKTKNDLIKLLEGTKQWTEEEFEKIKKQIYPTVSLKEAISPKNLHKTLKSNIQVVAEIDTKFIAATSITGKKYETADSENQVMQKGEERNWCLDDTNYKELFYMIDSNLKEKAIDKYIKTELLRIPEKEQCISIYKNQIPVYKGVITDTIESYSSTAPIELIAYSIGKPIESGKKYIATYKLIPHPQDGQKIIMVIKNLEESDDFLTKFRVNENIKESLKKFQIKQGQTVGQKLDELTNLAKGLVGYDCNNLLLKIIDIWFHSALQFCVGNKNKLLTYRGYIDALIIGESRIGKSSTVNALIQAYEVGKVVSLAGSAVTMAGLIGGSNKTAGGSFQTRAGIIPQNHKGALVFEELIKSDNKDLIKNLTEMRSSNKVRISRVNGSLELPATVRMLTLTNAKTHDGIPRPISSYNNGIEILSDIIGTPEDIARYDLIAIFGETARLNIDPFYEIPTPLPLIDYQNRIRWVWSRQPEQIYISKKVYEYTVNQANNINKEYGSFINIFGVEAWQKILRVAIAIAAYVCSTDDSFEQIIVEEEHIDEGIALLLSLYDNSTFKLKEYVAEEKAANLVTNEDLDVLEELWKTAPTLLEYLVKNQQTTRQNLSLMSGLQADVFNRVIYKLTKQCFIRIDKTYIIATNKYIKAFNKIDRSVTIKKEVVINIG